MIRAEVYRSGDVGQSSYKRVDLEPESFSHRMHESFEKVRPVDHISRNNAIYATPTFDGALYWYGKSMSDFQETHSLEMNNNDPDPESDHWYLFSGIDDPNLPKFYKFVVDAEKVRVYNIKDYDAIESELYWKNSMFLAEWLKLVEEGSITEEESHYFEVLLPADGSGILETIEYDGSFAIESYLSSKYIFSNGFEISFHFVESWDSLIEWEEAHTLIERHNEFATLEFQAEMMNAIDYKISPHPIDDTFSAYYDLILEDLEFYKEWQKMNSF